jgi:NTE family protein
MRRETRVGLVLGAGGVLGGAWLVGALHALRSELKWEPRSATHLVGTSAGATMAALLAAGVGADDLLPEAARTVKDTGDIAADSDWLLLELAAEANYRFAGHVPKPIPGSLGLCLAGLRSPGFWTPFRLISGLAPRGLVSTEPIKRTIRRVHEDGGSWPQDHACWIVATDYISGRRVVFGQEDSPHADLPDAVAASCAIPGFFEPQRIDGRLYVDGGIGSLSHLDLLAGAGLDLAICLNPMSARDRSAGWSPMGQMARAFARAAAWQLRREAERVRRYGTPVVLLEPCAEDLALMGNNLMEARKAIEVAQLASETVAAQLRELLEGGRLPDATVRTVRDLPAAA